MRALWLAAAAVFSLVATPFARAETATSQGPNPPAPSTMKGSKSTGAASVPIVVQDPAKAADIEKTLARIKVPPGFKISLYAQVPDARSIAVGPQGVVTFVSTRGNKIYAVTDRSHAGKASDVKDFAPAVSFNNPNGICFAKDGTLYAVEQNRILSFAAAELSYESPDVTGSLVVRQGHLIPPAEDSANHSARVCRIGPDNKLYVAIGQPYNVPPPDKYAPYFKAGLGSISRMDRDGQNRDVYAHGVRNSVGMDFSPTDGTLWFTDNQVDGMGDDIPPGEINHAIRIGENFGFPWYGGGHTRTVEYKDQTPPADVVFPAVEEVAHAADLGMTFYTGSMFPAEYKGAIFSAQHGSWNRTVPVGARVIVTRFKKDGTVDGSSVPFAEGWLNASGTYDGRPVDVAQLGDGSLLVTDDFAGAVYRITYSKP